VTLLEIAATSAASPGIEDIQKLLDSVESGILQSETKPSSLAALIKSLSDTESDSMKPILNFIESCSTRLSRKPVKYEDDMDALRVCIGPEDAICSTEPISLLWMPIVEQLPYALKLEDQSVTIITKWLQAFFSLCSQVGENTALLGQIRDQILGILEGKSDLLSNDEVDSFCLTPCQPPTSPSAHALDVSHVEAHQDIQSGDPVEAVIEKSIASEKQKNYAGLSKWMKKEVEEAIVDGDVSELILCACSEHSHIRREAIINIRKLIEKAKVSSQNTLISISLPFLIVFYLH
jgi:nucleolar pre-ribosomal-associated protein 1